MACSYRGKKLGEVEPRMLCHLRAMTEPSRQPCSLARRSEEHALLNSQNLDVAMFSCSSPLLFSGVCQRTMLFLIFCCWKQINNGITKREPQQLDCSQKPNVECATVPTLKWCPPCDCRTFHGFSQGGLNCNRVGGSVSTPPNLCKS